VGQLSVARGASQYDKRAIRMMGRSSSQKSSLLIRHIAAAGATSPLVVRAPSALLPPHSPTLSAVTASSHAPPIPLADGSSASPPPVSVISVDSSAAAGARGALGARSSYPSGEDDARGSEQQMVSHAQMCFGFAGGPE